MHGAGIPHSRQCCIFTLVDKCQLSGSEERNAFLYVTENYPEKTGYEEL